MYSSKTATQWLYCGCSIVSWWCLSLLRWSLLFILRLPALSYTIFLFGLVLFCPRTVWTEAACYKYFYANFIFTFDHLENKQKKTSCLSQTLNHCEEEKEEDLGHDATGKHFLKLSHLWSGEELLRRAEARFVAGCFFKMMCLSDPSSWNTQTKHCRRWIQTSQLLHHNFELPTLTVFRGITFKLSFLSQPKNTTAFPTFWRDKPHQSTQVWSWRVSTYVCHHDIIELLNWIITELCPTPPPFHP